MGDGVMQVSIPWGKDGLLEFRLPDRWELMDIAAPQALPPLNGIKGEIQGALKNPIGSDRISHSLSVGSRVVIVVDDISRPTPTDLIIPEIIEEIERGGVVSKDITIIFATGLHRGMNEDEMIKKVGRGVFEKIRCINHNCYDEDGLVYIGKTSRKTDVTINRTVVEADYRILVGTIEPHPQAGFGGGCKNILPGVAGAETIGQNHYLGANPDHFLKIGMEPDHDIMRQDIEEAALMLKGNSFIVNTILNYNSEIVKIVAGDPIAGHREGIKVAKKLYGVKINEEADIVISNSHPLNINLRQGVKGIANNLFAARESGTLILVTKCELGLDDIKIPDIWIPSLNYLGIARRSLVLLGKRGTHFLAKRLLSRLPVEERFFAYFALQAIRRNNIFIYSPNLYRDLGKMSKSFRVFDDMDEVLKVAGGHHGSKDRPKVIVLPYGGISYPILEPAQNSMEF